jgi:hypothetical protein
LWVTPQSGVDCTPQTSDFLQSFGTLQFYRKNSSVCSLAQHRFLVRILIFYWFFLFLNVLQWPCPAGWPLFWSIFGIVAGPRMRFVNVLISNLEVISILLLYISAQGCSGHFTMSGPELDPTKNSSTVHPFQNCGSGKRLLSKTRRWVLSESTSRVCTLDI